MIDLPALLDLADLATSRCEGVIAPADRSDLARVAQRARRRVGSVGEVLAVAFAGGTGSGKSSLINAIVGDVIVRTGVVRPTTDRALAVVPQESAVRYSRFLEDLDVGERIESDALKELILIDLPDLDSTAEGHKHVVESVLPSVDAVVWVFDPEKYSDATIHTEFLEKLVAYEDQFVFVLNQSDRIVDSVAATVEDLSRLLHDDGFREPAVLSTTADGIDSSVSDLATLLSERLDTKRSAIAKVAIDLRIAANDGWTATREFFSHSSGQAHADESGLAAATFVLLGVAASEVLRNLEEG
jgi:GTPase SAR1 family protein